MGIDIDDRGGWEGGCRVTALGGERLCERAHRWDYEGKRMAHLISRSPFPLSPVFWGKHGVHVTFFPLEFSLPLSSLPTSDFSPAYPCTNVLSAGVMAATSAALMWAALSPSIWPSKPEG